MTETFGEFRKAYAIAKNHKKAKFTFGGHEFVTKYAKYMIEYLKQKGCCDSMMVVFDEQRPEIMEVN